MEFFERAHVIMKNPEKKDSKSEENVKKQLKQMLHGYKRSDNKLIKEAGSGSNECENLVDVSSSVSGFSDLNLTDSSMEDDKSHELSTDNPRRNKTEEMKSNNSSNEEFTSEESFKVAFASIPEDDEDIHSLNEDTCLNSSSSDSEFLPFHDLEQATSSEITSSDSEFDRDGHLALKILKKLGKKKGSNSKRRKEKFDTILKESNVIDTSVNDSDITSLDMSQKANDEEDLEKANSDNSVNFNEEHSTSCSPYISLTAEHMPDQSLSEILGEYKYPTMKNLPCNKQNVINSSLFSTKNVHAPEIHVDEDVISFKSELVEEPTIEELEIDVGVDLRLEQTNEVSTIVYDDKIQSKELSPDIQDSTPTVALDYGNTVKLYYSKNKCIFILKHPSKIYIHGKVRIKVVGGAAEAFGYTLKSNYCDLYAPNYNYAHYIKTVASENMYYGLFGKLTSSGLSVQEAEEIVTELGEYDTVIIMSALSSRKMDFVEDNFRIVDLFSRQNKRIDDFFKQASEILNCNLYLLPRFGCYEVNSIWEHFLNCGEGNKRRTILCGSKGLGKSTFLRYYVNRLLAYGPVLVIDLDPGQAEFTVAGHLSVTVATKPLLGPSFTHLTSPDLMLNIGMINPMDNPTRYVNSVAEVVAHCHSHTKYKSMPWIINTMGMTNNMGLKFITLIIMHIQPTFVLQIDNKIIKKGYGTVLRPDVVRKILNDYKNDRLFKNVVKTNLNYNFFIHTREDREVKSMSLAPRDERYLNFLAYFGELMIMHRGPGLLGIIPYEVNLHDLNIGINVKIPKDAVTKVINGKIIALCQISTLDKGKVFVLGDNAVRCLGHGLVRSVDFEKGILYVVTPTPIDTLSMVNTLMYADWVPELIGEERRLPDGTAVPYRAAPVNYKQKQLMFAPRRRFNPMQLLKSKGTPKLKPSVIS